MMSSVFRQWKWNGSRWPGLQHEDLLAVGRALLGAVDVAVAHVEHRDADLVEVALAEIGDGPAEPVARDARILGAGLAPVVRAPVRVLGQAYAVLGSARCALSMAALICDRFIVVSRCNIVVEQGGGPADGGATQRSALVRDAQARVGAQRVAGEDRRDVGGGDLRCGEELLDGRAPTRGSVAKRSSIGQSDANMSRRGPKISSASSSTAARLGPRASARRTGMAGPRAAGRAPAGARIPHRVAPLRASTSGNGSAKVIDRDRPRRKPRRAPAADAVVARLGEHRHVEAGASAAARLATTSGRATNAGSATRRSCARMPTTLGRASNAA